MSNLTSKFKDAKQKISDYYNNVNKSFSCDKKDLTDLTIAERFPREMYDAFKEGYGLTKRIRAYEINFKPIDIPLNYVKGAMKSFIANDEEGKDITKLQKVPKAILDLGLCFTTLSLVFGGSELLKQEYNINLDNLAIPIVMLLFYSMFDLSFTMMSGSSIIGQFKESKMKN